MERRRPLVWYLPPIVLSGSMPLAVPFGMLQAAHIDQDVPAPSPRRLSALLRRAVVVFVLSGGVVPILPGRKELVE
jgi:hypothetical protein